MAVAAGACPGCGAPIEFSIGSSVSCVCEFCRSTVYRTDRGLEDLGKAAALANVPSLIAIGDEGTIAGRRMRVAGRVQLDQGQGPWDEWYVALDNGASWAWLAYAEGIWFVTSLVVPTPQVKPLPLLRVEDDIQLGANGVFRVGEVKTARVVSAEGELPGKFPPGLVRGFADCHAPGSRFATVDFGEGTTATEVFVGARLEEAALQVTALGPRSQNKVPLAAIRCPNCGGDIPKLAGDRIQRVGCRYCGAITDIASQRVVAAQDAARVTPPIPIGAKGRLGDDFTCIAYLRRSTADEGDEGDDGERYTWEEQLLFGPRTGFRWLVLDEGEWLFVEPLNIADVTLGSQRGTVRFQNQQYTLRNSAEARVDHVLGELYWRCEVGERVAASDYVSGRTVLSREETPGEVHWSRSTPIPWPVLAKAFGLDASRAPVQAAKAAGISVASVFVIVFILVIVLVVFSSSGGGGSGGGGVGVFPVPIGGSTYGGSSTYHGGK